MLIIQRAVTRKDLSMPTQNHCFRHWRVCICCFDCL